MAIYARDYSLESMTDNIQALLEQSSQEDINTGTKWYSNARGLVGRLSSKYNYPIETVIGVLSALSPETGWSQNVKDTIGLLEDNNAIVSTYDRNRDKALDIKSGRLDAHSHYSQHWIKTAAFYTNILEPSANYRVTIDRHSARIAHGYYLTGQEAIYYCNTRAKYTKTEFAFRHVAAANGYLCQQLQAITWLAYRRLFVSKRQNDVIVKDIIL